MKIYSRHNLGVGLFVSILTTLVLYLFRDSIPAWFLWLSVVWNLGIFSLFFRQAFRPPIKNPSQSQG
jgi:hypothetical protein